MAEVPSTTSFDWAGEAGRRWLAMADRLERQLEPVSEALFARAGLARGEAVLDVGCGRGATTRAAAAAVGPGGRAVGIDIAGDLLQAAAELDTDGRCEWINADVQEHPFTPAFDVVMSRFGVMFFADADRAFANLAQAARPGARLVMAVWQTRDRSPVQQGAMDAARRAAAARGIEAPIVPPDAGPFSFGRPDHALGVLQRAGWTDAGFERVTVALHAGGRGATLTEAASTMHSIGPFSVWVQQQDPDVAAAIRGAIEESLVPHHDGFGYRMESGIAILTARRP